MPAAEGRCVVKLATPEDPPVAVAFAVTMLLPVIVLCAVAAPPALPENEPPPNVPVVPPVAFVAAVGSFGKKIPRLMIEPALPPSPATLPVDPEVSPPCPPVAFCVRVRMPPALEPLTALFKVMLA